jgi:osmotically-inducible protein OsmY
MDDVVIREQVEAGLSRIAGDTSGVEVSVRDGKVTLRGAVASWFDADAAERAAWAAPGARAVENLLVYPPGTGTAEVENIP